MDMDMSFAMQLYVCMYIRMYVQVIHACIHVLTVAGGELSVWYAVWFSPVWDLRPFIHPIISHSSHPCHPLSAWKRRVSGRALRLRLRPCDGHNGAGQEGEPRHAHARRGRRPPPGGWGNKYDGIS